FGATRMLRRTAWPATTKPSKSSRRRNCAPQWHHSENPVLSCSASERGPRTGSGFVGDQDRGGHLRQQRIGAGEIMGLSRGQQEAQRIAERVDQSMDFGAQSALATANCLIIVFFWVRRRCAGERARWCCQSSHIRCRARRSGARRGAATPLYWPSG